MTINWITPKHPGRGNNPSAQDAMFSISEHKAGKSYTDAQGVITVSEKAMKALGWLSGDKVTMAQDGTLVYMRRVQDKGFTLSQSNKIEGRRVQFGHAVKCTVKTTDLKFGPGIRHIKNYQVRDGIVTFDIAETI